MQISFSVPRYRWVERLLEWVFPGIVGQFERWGRVHRRKVLGGGAIDIGVTVSDD